MNWDWEKLQQKQQERSRGSGGGGGGMQPPRMDELLNKFKEIKFTGGWIVIAIVLLLILVGYSMVFTVGSNEVGVVQRFGKYVRTVPSGLEFKWPTPVETVRKVKTEYVYTERFGLRGKGAAGQGSTYGQDENDIVTMLTGDLNVAVVPWIVQYRIKNPYNYLFKVQDVPRLIRDMAEASMRLVVGDRSINDVLSNRQKIAIDAKNRLQKDLDEAQTGVEIVTVELENTNVPEPVQDSFNEVNRATQEKEQTIYKAKEEYNRVIPKARGEAQQTVEAAKGYAARRINRAKGETARFTALYDIYKKERDVTRRRLYLEMLEDVVPKFKQKYIIDSREKNLLPLLNIGETLEEKIGGRKGAGHESK